MEEGGFKFVISSIIYPVTIEEPYRNERWILTL